MPEDPGVPVPGLVAQVVDGHVLRSVALGEEADDLAARQGKKRFPISTRDP